MSQPKANSSNVDAAEIAKFAALADQWWDPKGNFKPLHTINPLRVSYIEKQCGQLRGKDVLDVGCGGGILSESLAKLGANVTGLDMAHDSLTVAQHHAQQAGLTINYRQQTVEEHAQALPQHYDVITCMEMLEHVPDPASIIQACAQLLKPGGKLLLSTINRNRKAQFLLIICAEYLTNMVPRGTHQFEKFIRPSELMHWGEQANLSTLDITGMEYQLLKNQFKLSKNSDVNYLMTMTKPD